MSIVIAPWAYNVVSITQCCSVTSVNALSELSIMDCEKWFETTCSLDVHLYVAGESKVDVHSILCLNTTCHLNFLLISYYV
jgi:hypothetical protein